MPLLAGGQPVAGDVDGLSRRMIEALEAPLAQAPIREAARRVDRRSICGPTGRLIMAG